jgi:hypothetical protein
MTPAEGPDDDQGPRQERLWADDSEPSGSRAAELARSVKQFILDHRYFVLSGVLVLLVLSSVLKGQWAAGIDVWEHAAAARELGRHPFDPDHPLFPIDAPHQLLSPYHLVLGLLARLPGLSIVMVFNLAAIGNVVLLVVGLRMFTRRLLGRRHVEFYALLFMLFLWGPTPWFFSGFLHFNVFPLVLSYPATFAKGLVFVGWAVYLRFLDADDRRCLVATAGIGAVLLLAHPVDALFFFVGLGAFAVTRKPDQLSRHVTVTALTMAVSVGLALLWPYYSLYDLVLGSQNEPYRTGLASADRDMYVNVLPRLWPALIAVPFIVRRLLHGWRDPLLLILGGLLLLYAYGWRTEEWAFGRILSAIVVIAAIILADETVRATEEAAAMGDAGRSAARWIQFGTLGLVALGMFQVRHGFVMLPDSLLEHMPYSAVHGFVEMVPTSKFSFLSEYAGDGQVVITDSGVSKEVPAFGAKVLSYSAPEAFVDTTTRNSDQATFFTASTPETVRRQIIEKYGASFLVLSQQNLKREPQTYEPLKRLGTVVHSNDRLVLVDLRRPHG